MKILGELCSHPANTDEDLTCVGLRPGPWGHASLYLTGAALGGGTDANKHWMPQERLLLLGVTGLCLT